MSTKCPHGCPNVHFRQYVRKMSAKCPQKMSTCPEPRSPKHNPGQCLRGFCPNVRTNVQMSTFRDKNVAKMSTRMSPNHPATYSRSAARFVRWPVDIADEERLHVSRCPKISPRHHGLPVYSVDWRRSSASKALCRGSCALFQCPNVKGP